MNEEMREYQQLQLRQMRLQTTILALILVVCLVTGLFMTFQISGVVKKVDAIDLTGLQEVLDPSELQEAVTAMKAAADALGDADMDAVNDGIRSLSDAADKLSSLDVERINSLINSLNTVAGKMESTSNMFSGLFKR